MPTVLRLDGLSVRIYPNDHRPAHVHVIGPGAEAVFVLNCPEGPTRLRESYGFTGPAVRALEASLNALVNSMCLAWERFHGADR